MQKGVSGCNHAKARHAHLCCCCCCCWHGSGVAEHAWQHPSTISISCTSSGGTHPDKNVGRQAGQGAEALQQDGVAPLSSHVNRAAALWAACWAAVGSRSLARGAGGHGHSSAGCSALTDGLTWLRSEGLVRNTARNRAPPLSPCCNRGRRGDGGGMRQMLARHLARVTLWLTGGSSRPSEVCCQRCTSEACCQRCNCHQRCRSEHPQTTPTLQTKLACSTSPGRCSAKYEPRRPLVRRVLSTLLVLLLPCMGVRAGGGVP